MSNATKNKVNILGYCGQDPETRHMPSGDTVTNISVATSESWKDKETGDKEEQNGTELFYKNLSKIADTCLEKGSKIDVEGQLRTREWKDKTDPLIIQLKLFAKNYVCR